MWLQGGIGFRWGLGRSLARTPRFLTPERENWGTDVIIIPMDSTIQTQAPFRRSSREQLTLLLGDVLTLGVVTLLGFARHDIMDAAPGRFWLTFIPWVGAWVLASTLTGALDPLRAREARGLWRPLWALVLATPLAATLRAAWLDAPVQWIFVVALAGVGALGLGLWRALYLLWRRRSGANGDNG